MKIEFGGKELIGQRIDKQWKNCMHFGEYTSIMNDSDRIWIKLNKSLNVYNICVYPYEIASFNKNSIVIIED